MPSSPQPPSNFVILSKKKIPMAILNIAQLPQQEEGKVHQTITSTVNVVYVLGAPGSGKGTQCKKIVQKYRGVKHLSIGDVLRAERDTPGSIFAKEIAENMRLGRIRPVELSAILLSKAMDHAAKVEGINKFLIDGIVSIPSFLHCKGLFLALGFPRTMEQYRIFEKHICSNTATVFLDCSEYLRRERLLQRGENNMSPREDDNWETIKKRFVTFENETLEVVTFLHQNKALVRVDAGQDASAVFADFEKAVKKILRLEERSGSTGGMGCIL